MISGVLHGTTLAMNQICCSCIMIMKPAGCQYGVCGSRVMRDYLKWTGKGYKEMENMENIFIPTEKFLLDSYCLSACLLFHISICPSIMCQYLWNWYFERIQNRYKVIKVVEYNFDTFHFFLATLTCIMSLIFRYFDFVDKVGQSICLVGWWIQGRGWALEPLCANTNISRVVGRITNDIWIIRINGDVAFR